MRIITKLFNVVYDLIHARSDNRAIKEFTSTLKSEYPNESDDYIKNMAISLYWHNRRI